ncbi:type II toxin-antitoxin system Phd/YefM family antitoxin [Sphingobium sp. V4]|uniref:type II toxin-antitoxin system Phd/YefM family antitoxin n=1 Tax=Sphingobium sp. V4 TaxID=3038927 RepID=UPI0025580D4E|nr:type II toxin-antitoxin system Phd/YefM family antitoxin [Sphingobium sp. V4]WIW89625.1 type II toxin-antitoxin system Phd/YefM family antitoxin [Sphingobium sp. V4]
MTTSKDVDTPRTRKAASRLPPPARGWKLEDAKARFSELVRLARSEGPQRVTVRGKDAVVVISADELERLLPPERKKPLVAFLEGLHLDGVDLTREQDTGRDISL